MDRKQYHRYIYSLAILFITCIALFVFSIIWADRAADSARDDANRAVRESEKTHCIVYDLIHEGQLQAPPTTPQGKQFAEAVNQIRARLKCEEKK